MQTTIIPESIILSSALDMKTQQSHFAMMQKLQEYLKYFLLATVIEPQPIEFSGNILACELEKSLLSKSVDANGRTIFKKDHTQLNLISKNSNITNTPIISRNKELKSKKLFRLMINKKIEVKQNKNEEEVHRVPLIQKNKKK
mgnify:FL=1